MPLRSTFAGTCALIAALVSTPACGADAMPTSPAPTTTRTVVVLGDSLSVHPGPSASFPAVLQRRVQEAGLPWRVVNHGRNGDTTAQGLTRLEDALRERPAVLVLALGANDGLRGVPVSVVQGQLDTIIRRAKASGARVLLCGMETPPFRGWEYTRQFHAIYPDLATTHDLPLVPFLLMGVFGNLDLNGPDMIHPNAAGATRIAENVWPYLEKMLEK